MGLPQKAIPFIFYIVISSMSNIKILIRSALKSRTAKVFTSYTKPLNQNLPRPSVTLESSRSEVLIVSASVNGDCVDPSGYQSWNLNNLEGLTHLTSLLKLEQKAKDLSWPAQTHLVKEGGLWGKMSNRETSTRNDVNKRENVCTFGGMVGHGGGNDKTYEVKV